MYCDYTHTSCQYNTVLAYTLTIQDTVLMQYERDVRACQSKHLRICHMIRIIFHVSKYPVMYIGLLTVEKSHKIQYMHEIDPRRINSKYDHFNDHMFINRTTTDCGDRKMKGQRIGKFLLWYRLDLDWNSQSRIHLLQSSHSRVLVPNITYPCRSVLLTTILWNLWILYCYGPRRNQGIYGQVHR